MAALTSETLAVLHNESVVAGTLGVHTKILPD